MQKELLRPDFYWIPNIVASSVGAHESFVFAVVYWFNNLKDGRCYASNERIAEALPYESTPNSVGNALLALERAGFVLRVFDDNQRRNRKEIQCLVQVTKVPPTGVTRSTHRCDGVPPTGGQRNKREEEEKGIKRTSEATASHDPLGAEIIKAFEAINPACKKMYGNKTQREACDDLIETYGLEQVLRVIAVLPQTNGRQYVPTVTTPLQLRDKWVQLENALKRIKDESTTKNNCIIL